MSSMKLGAVTVLRINVHVNEMNDDIKFGLPADLGSWAESLNDGNGLELVFSNSDSPHSGFFSIMSGSVANADPEEKNVFSIYMSRDELEALSEAAAFAAKCLDE